MGVGSITQVNSLIVVPQTAASGQFPRYLIINLSIVSVEIICPARSLTTLHRHLWSIRKHLHSFATTSADIESAYKSVPHKRSKSIFLTTTGIIISDKIFHETNAVSVEAQPVSGGQTL